MFRLPPSEPERAPPTSTRAPPHRPRIVIVGCGFAGLAAARALAQAPVDVTVVDRTNHHLFQPLLYQVATAGLSAPSIAAPTRHLFRHQHNITTLLAEVEHLDVARHCVHLRGTPPLCYDHLILASGATHGYFGHPEWAAHAPGLKTLADAMAIRRRVLLAFEAAEKAPSAAERDPWLQFVVVGGGPTGVELAGALAEIAHRTLAGEFRHIEPQRARILLVEGSDRLLQAFHPRLGTRARAQLEALGVEVRLNTRVIQIDAQQVTLQAAGSADPEHLATRCVLWAAGVAASPLGQDLARQVSGALDRAGRVRVLPDLSVTDHPEISVVGDLAAAFSHAPGHDPQPVPGIAPAAKQMGRHAAASVLRRLQGLPTAAFRYRHWGDLATIGRNAAVVELPLRARPLRFSGYPAWLFWLFAHVFFLIGFRNRVAVLFDWGWAYVSAVRSARVVVETDEGL